MQNIASIINKEKFSKPSYPQKIIKTRNFDYEDAEVMAKSVGVNKFILMRQFKIFGKQNVLSLQGWLTDLPHDPTRGKVALLVCELNRRFPNKKTT